MTLLPPFQGKCWLRLLLRKRKKGLWISMHRLEKGKQYWTYLQSNYIDKRDISDTVSTTKSDKHDGKMHKLLGIFTRVDTILSLHYKRNHWISWVPVADCGTAGARGTYFSPFCRVPTELSLLKLWCMQSIVPMPEDARLLEWLLLASLIAWWLTHLNHFNKR